MDFYPPGTKEDEKRLMDIFLVAIALVLLVSISAFFVPFFRAGLLVLAWAILMVFAILMGMELVVFRILVRNEEKEE